MSMFSIETINGEHFLKVRLRSSSALRFFVLANASVSSLTNFLIPPALRTFPISLGVVGADDSGVSCGVFVVAIWCPFDSATAEVSLCSDERRARTRRSTSNGGERNAIEHCWHRNPNVGIADCLEG